MDKDRKSYAKERKGKNCQLELFKKSLVKIWQIKNCMKNSKAPIVSYFYSLSDICNTQGVLYDFIPSHPLSNFIIF